MIDDIVKFLFPTNFILFKDKVLLNNNVLPTNYVESKKMLQMLGVEYKSYHACLNDCILYRTKRGVENVGMIGTNNKKNKHKEHVPPYKILRHMIIIPRIQRFFRCKQLA